MSGKDPFAFRSRWVDWIDLNSATSPMYIYSSRMKVIRTYFTKTGYFTIGYEDRIETVGRISAQMSTLAYISERSDIWIVFPFL